MVSLASLPDPVKNTWWNCGGVNSSRMRASSMAGCVLLTELARPDVVRELTFSGRIVSGSEAQALGLATRVSATPLADARALAAAISGRSPDAIRAAKRLLNGASPVHAAAVLMAESHEQQRLIGSPNQREAALAGLEKREPKFVD